MSASQTAEQAARRTLAEKAGVRNVYLEQLATFADPVRNPRGWIPTIAHLALVPATVEPADPGAQWDNARGRRPLAYDHRQILRTAVDRVEGKLWWSTSPSASCPGRSP